MSDVEVVYAQHCASCGIVFPNTLGYPPHLLDVDNKLTQDLCFLYKRIEKNELIDINQLPLEMQNWWKQHKEEDSKREQPYSFDS